MTPEELAALARATGEIVRETVAKATASLVAQVEELKQRLASVPAGRDGKDGAPGRDGDNGAAGKDGASGERGTDGAPGRDGLLGERGADGRHGIDGANGKDGAPGRDGEHGAAGRDGLAGERGSPGPMPDAETVRAAFSDLCEKEVSGWALNFERRATDILLRAVDALPRPKDGAPGVSGRDGIDGMGFDDFSIEHDGGRKFTFVLQRGDVVKRFEFTVPMLIERGVHKDQSYQKGDAVTFQGGFWIAQRDVLPTERPSLSDAWRLAVKKGRDGKDGKDGAKGEHGARGPSGYTPQSDIR